MGDGEDEEAPGGEPERREDLPVITVAGGLRTAAAGVRFE